MLCILLSFFTPTMMEVYALGIPVHVTVYHLNFLSDCTWIEFFFFSVQCTIFSRSTTLRWYFGKSFTVSTTKNIETKKSIFFHQRIEFIHPVEIYFANDKSHVAAHIGIHKKRFEQFLRQKFSFVCNRISSTKREEKKMCFIFNSNFYFKLLRS